MNSSPKFMFGLINGHFYLTDGKKYHLFFGMDQKT